MQNIGQWMSGYGTVIAGLAMVTFDAAFRFNID